MFFRLIDEGSIFERFFLDHAALPIPASRNSFGFESTPVRLNPLASVGAVLCPSAHALGAMIPDPFKGAAGRPEILGSGSSEGGSSRKIVAMKKQMQTSFVHQQRFRER